MVKMMWEDTPKSENEEDLQKEKQEQKTKQDAEQSAEQKDAQKKGVEGFAAPTEPDLEGEDIIADTVLEGWNEVAVPKGYEPVLDKQERFYKKHMARFEDKYLRNMKNLIPEIEAALATGVIFVPKYLKKKAANMKEDKKK